MVSSLPGLIDGIVGVIGALDPEIRNDILDEGAGILLSGSSSMFQGVVLVIIIIIIIRNMYKFDNRSDWADYLL